MQFFNSSVSMCDLYRIIILLAYSLCRLNDYVFYMGGNGEDCDIIRISGQIGYLTGCKTSNPEGELPRWWDIFPDDQIFISLFLVG